MRPVQFRLRTLMAVILVMALELALFVVFAQQSSIPGTPPPDYLWGAVCLLMVNWLIIAPLSVLGFLRALARTWHLWPYHDRPGHNDPNRGRRLAREQTQRTSSW